MDNGLWSSQTPSPQMENLLISLQVHANAGRSRCDSTVLCLESSGIITCYLKSEMNLFNFELFLCIGHCITEEQSSKKFLFRNHFEERSFSE